jgi:DNA-binding transcriptional ArsR family regulator
MGIEQSMYEVVVDWSPTYELAVSLRAFLGRSEHKTFELGPGWPKLVRQSLTPALSAQLSSMRVLDDFIFLDLLIRRCPGERRVSDFIPWLAGLSAGQLYEWLAPIVPAKQAPALMDLAGIRDRYVEILDAWNEQYFQGVDPAILTGLERDAAEKRELLGHMEPPELVEIATSGMTVQPQGHVDWLWLVPQYHYRPWNLLAFFRTGRLIQYPVDALPLGPDEISPRLRRLTKAVSDESRLRILRLLSAGPASFTDVVTFIKLSKSTVNHHLVVLRAAGLVRVHDSGERSTTYSLRPDALDLLHDDLRSYLSIP